METFFVILGLAIRAGQVFAIIVCCRKDSPRWMKIFGAIGAILFLIAYLGNGM